MGEGCHTAVWNRIENTFLSFKIRTADVAVLDIVDLIVGTVQADTGFSQPPFRCVLKVYIAFESTVGVVGQLYLLSGFQIAAEHIGEAGAVADQIDKAVVSRQRGAGKIQKLGIIVIAAGNQLPWVERSKHGKCPPFDNYLISIGQCAAVHGIVLACNIGTVVSDEK